MVLAEARIGLDELNEGVLTLASQMIGHCAHQGELLVREHWHDGR